MKTDVKFAANVKRVDGHWYVNNLFMYTDDEDVNMVDVRRLSPFVYMRLHRRLSSIKVNSAYELKIYIDDDVDFVDDVKYIHEVQASPSINVQPEAVELESKRLMYKYNVRTELAKNTQMFPITLFNYMKIGFELAGAGFFVTDDNREEQYLAIINTGDEKLIDNLSKYLDAYDDLSANSKYITIYNNAVKLIDSAKTVEELDTVYTDKIASTLCEVV